MSDSLYWARLRWHNGLGVAKSNGTTVSLSVAPDLGSGPVHQLDYVPEIDQADVAMDVREPMRRMTLHEIHTAGELLNHLTREVPRESCRFDEPWKDGRC